MAYKIPVVETSIHVNDFSVVLENNEVLSTLPVYLTVFSSDKGPEGLVKVEGDEFFKLYGDKKHISYKKHGQPLIQAAASIEAGATLLCKRVVASDATLGNITIFAEAIAQPRKIIKTKKDAHNRDRLVYEDPSVASSDENEYTWDGEGKYVPKLIADPQSRQSVLVRYFVESMENAKDIKDIIRANEAKRTGNVYPIATIVDNGRGVCAKSIRLAPSYLSRATGINALKHTLQVIEDNKVVEECEFIYDPSTLLNGTTNIGLNVAANKHLKQVKAYQYEDSVSDYIQFIVDTTKGEDETEEEFRAYLSTIDVMYGKDRKRLNVEQIQCAESPSSANNSLFTEPQKTGVVNLTSPHGTPLLNGTNGNFGDAPYGTDEYETQIVNFFDGEYTSEIYDLDSYQIDMIIDANYSQKVKNIIVDFVNNYRDDCVYIRDFGLGANSMQEIEQILSGYPESRVVADYCLSYDIIDPYSNKQIPVTCAYDLAIKFVEHFKRGRHRPCAGLPYGFTLDSAIRGTESFIPTRNKFSDQREALTDKRINYAVYHDNKLVVETLFTAQREIYSQMSFLSNVLNIQRLVKLIRVTCPRNRYAFVYGKDLDNYKEDIKHILEVESGNFHQLNVKFTQDSEDLYNKQIHVIVEVTCKEFFTSEAFDINIINL